MTNFVDTNFVVVRESSFSKWVAKRKKLKLLLPVKVDKKIATFLTNCRKNKREFAVKHPQIAAATAKYCKTLFSTLQFLLIG